MTYFESKYNLLIFILIFPRKYGVKIKTSTLEDMKGEQSFELVREETGVLELKRASTIPQPTSTNSHLLLENNQDLSYSLPGCSSWLFSYLGDGIDFQ
jgi:hypothetical protein